MRASLSKARLAVRSRLLAAFSRLHRLYRERVPGRVRAWAPHVLLLVATLLYVALGGICFRAVQLNVCKDRLPIW